MAASTDYWHVASGVQAELNALSGLGDDMYGNLEADDDPGAIAEALADIEKRLLKLATQIGPNVSALRKVAKAMDDIPGIK